MGLEAHRNWQGTYEPEELAAVRTRIPEAIQLGHEDGAKAQDALRHREALDRRVYGVAAAQSIHDEFRRQFSSLPRYREEPAPRGARSLMLLGDNLILPLRVGTRMPADRRRIRVPQRSQTREAVYRQTGQPEHPHDALFTLERALVERHAPALDDALEMLCARLAHCRLFIAYFSSQLTGVGEMYFAPARRDGNYLLLMEPERLHRAGSIAAPAVRGIAPATNFGSVTRPSTPVSLRSRDTHQEGS